MGLIFPYYFGLFTASDDSESDLDSPRKPTSDLEFPMKPTHLTLHKKYQDEPFRLPTIKEPTPIDLDFLKLSCRSVLTVFGPFGKSFSNGRLG